MTVDQWMVKRCEAQILAMAYPAALPPQLKRLIALKLAEIGAHFNARSQAIAKSMSAFVDVSTDEMTHDDRELVAAVREIETERRRLFDLFKQRGYSHTIPTGACRERTTAERQEHEAERKAAEARFMAERDAALAQLKALVAELAQAQIAAVRAKVPADLAKRLDAIAVPQLEAPDLEDVA